MRVSKVVSFVIALCVGLPALAHAQATLAGVVKDSSGAVLPGVTVEAGSPVLIEKTRTAVTDGTGQFRFESLPPGTYTVTFTLSGFSTVKRQAVDVSGAGVITINTELHVGAVSETVTVTGETPVVDVQSARHQQVLDNRVVSEIPATRGYNAILAAIPSVTGGSLDVDLGPTMRIFTSHGGRGNEGHVQVDGLDVGAAFNGGGVSGYIMDTTNAAELQFTLSGGLGEVQTGGINLNIVPKTGGNVFKGQAFGSGAGSWSQGNNIDAAQEAAGILNPPTLHNAWDVSGSLGGPIKRDRLWFFATTRSFGSAQDVAGLYLNANMGDPNQWTYVPNQDITTRNATSRTIFAGRVQAQITPKNKIGFYLDHQLNCDQSAYIQNAGNCRSAGTDWIATGGLFGGTFAAPEAFTSYADTYQQVRQATWTSTVTAKLLLEAGFSSYVSRWGWMRPPGAITNLEQVTDFGRPAPPFQYRALDDFFNNYQSPNVWRASASYVTGAHNMKFGYQGAYLIEEIEEYADDPQLTYTFFGGVPVSLTQRIAPWDISNRTMYSAFFAQDQWTLKRLTLQGAVRYDRAWSWFPADHNGAPVANLWSGPISFPKSEGVNAYNDITPRMGMAYDLFGNGKTSFRVNLGKYLQNANNQENYTISNPTLDGRNGRRGPTFQVAQTRSWSDANGNFVPDCDLTNQAANGECGAGSPNFANPLALTQFNPDVLKGWGVRPYDWQFGASVQQEILPRTSIEVGYSRRWFGNFFVYDNQLIGPNDFQPITVTAPNIAKLPNGGGFPVDYNMLKPGTPTTVQDLYTFANDYGNYNVHWQGVDVTLNARLKNGFVFQGGTSTGRGVTDFCQVAAQVPELLQPALVNSSLNLNTNPWQPASACHVAENWLTQFRGLASYTIPKWDVLVSGIVQLKPNVSTGPTDTTVGTNGTSLAANYAVSPTQTVNLLQPGLYYGTRVNTVDLRAAKVLTLGHARTTVGFDLYNLFNANPGLAFNQNFGDASLSSYLRPTTILNPRFVRFNITVDF
jgi:hypothetical protein